MRFGKEPFYFTVFFLFQMASILLMVVPISSLYIFTWKTFNTAFLTNISNIKNLQSNRNNVTVYKIFLILMVIMSTLLPCYNAGLFETFTALDNVVWNSHTIMQGLFQITNIWLGTFTMVSLVYILATSISLFKEYQFINKELFHLIKTSKIYQPGIFCNWVRSYQVTSDLAENFNEHVKLYLAHALILSTLNIMGVLYNTTVVCTSPWSTAGLTTQFSINIIVIMVPAVAMNIEVSTCTHKSL